MKKKSKGLLACAVLGAWVVLLAGCATSPVVNKFMNPELSVKEHALLIIDNNIGVGMIDGELTFGSSGAGTDGTLRSRTPMLLLIPGQHTLMVQYIEQAGNTRTTSDLIPVTGNLLPGHAYRLNPSINGNTVSFDFIAETDTSIWETKDLVSIRPSKKVLASTVINKASSEAATQFQGTWFIKEIPAEFASSGTTEISITFTGKSYFVKLSRPFTDDQLKGQNDIRKMSGQSTLVSPAFLGQRGTFEFSNNTLTLQVLQNTLDNVLDNAQWTTIKKLNINFDYSLDSSGNLVLSFKNGNRLWNYLGKTSVLEKKE
jgi:hypothetical protein